MLSNRSRSKRLPCTAFPMLQVKELNFADDFVYRGLSLLNYPLGGAGRHYPVGVILLLLDLDSQLLGC